MPPRSYVILLPALWMAVDAVNFRYPGDEYGGWAVGSLPGLWILWIVGDGGSPARLLPLVLAAGGLVMAALGAMMDGLRVPPIPWATLATILAGAFGAYALSDFPSWERAMAKNGSWMAYVLPSVSLGLMGSSILTVAATGVFRLASRRRAAGGAGEHGVG